MKIQRAWKFKLEINKREFNTLSLWLSHLRCLYNLALEQRILAYSSQARLSLNYYDQANELSELKKQFPFFKEVPSQLLQQKLKDVEAAYKRFFNNGAGFPKFKKKRDLMGMRFPDAKQFFVEYRNGKRTSIVTLPKIGVLKFVSSRPIVGAIKNCSITKKADGFYISFQSEYEAALPIHVKPTLGIDRGVRTTAMTSNGEALTLPIEKIQDLEVKIARAQKSLAKKLKGSRNFNKQVTKINLVYKKITDIKTDTMHKLTSSIAKNHGIVVIEDLRIKNMTASSKGTADDPGVKVKQKSGLNRAILRNNWGEFERQLTYKLTWSGGRVIKVPPHYTSQTCHQCGHVDPKNRNGIEFLCLQCGHRDHADANAAQNILALGQSVTVCGETTSGVLAKSKTRKVSVKQKPMVAQAPGILGL